MTQSVRSYNRRPALALLGVLLFLGAGCSRYEQKPLPIRLPSTYANAAEVFGATVAVEPWADKEKARELFGFDIVAAGVLPVQIVIDHQGTDPIEIDPTQTFLVDSKGQLWNIMDRSLTYKRIESSTEWGKIPSEAGKGAVLGATAGAILGAAVGIVTGENVLKTTGKGAAVGGAGGAVLGGTKGLNDPEVTRSIRDDLRKRSLENRPIPPQGISHGVLFFPAEAIEARQLRVRFRNTATGEIVQRTFGL
ncbi:MAG: lipoprotein [Deferrisomatales bacterium]